MDRRTELALLERCLDLSRRRSTQLSDGVMRSGASRYVDPAQFQQEWQAIFRRLPFVAAHSSQIAEPGSFLTQETPRGPVLLTRTADGEVRGFHNVCRHRGTRVVQEASGCAERFSCPYHAWTYSNTGELIGVPHQESCFPGLDRARHGLVRVEVCERHGLLWVGATPSGLDPFLAGLAADLEWLDLPSLAPFATDSREWNGNWKLVAEGGLEAYHFRQAHKKTIAPYFYDNLALYERFGAHFRQVLPRKSLESLGETPRDQWRLREHSHLTYALFPMTTLLVQSDHVVLIQALPLAADRTRISITTLVPADDRAPARASYWQTNHAITCATLNEDFALAESIQASLVGNPDAELLFGRSEGALAELKQVIDGYLVPASGRHAAPGPDAGEETCPQSLQNS